MTEVIAGAALGVGGNLAAQKAFNEKPDGGIDARILETLRRIERNTTPPERAPLIAEIGVTFAAGVASNRIDFIPQSSFVVENIILTASVAGVEIEIRQGTRGPRVVTVVGSLNLPLPYHWNGGQAVTLLDPSGAANVNIRGFIVGHYEHNRLGPQKVIGTDL